MPLPSPTSAADATLCIPSSLAWMPPHTNTLSTPAPLAPATSCSSESPTAIASSGLDTDPVISNTRSYMMRSGLPIRRTTPWLVISAYHLARTPGIGSNPASPPMVTTSGLATMRGRFRDAARSKTSRMSSREVFSHPAARCSSSVPAPLTASVPCARRKSASSGSVTVSRSRPSRGMAPPRLDQVKCTHFLPSDAQNSSSESLSSPSPVDPLPRDASIWCVTSPLVTHPENHEGSKPMGASFWSVFVDRLDELDITYSLAPDSCSLRAASTAPG
mmetsp:Transcript_5424/g.24133  ORF Transcript_5424/g.24133 Transcript_5424/m.24133 type:complete len:275 (+) Transcript_5424:242-1066(+)